jgi:WD40 repeat protein/uncharacterized caspase-like protein
MILQLICTLDLLKTSIDMSLPRCSIPIYLIFWFSIAIAQAQQPQLMVPTGHVLSVSDVDFNKNGKYMVTVAENEIKYWETATGKLIYNLKSNRYEGFTNGGKTLMTVDLKNDSTGNVKFWDLSTGNVIDSLPGITIRISKDQQRLMLSSGTDSVSILDAKTKKKLFSLPGSIGVFINDDKQIFTANLLSTDTGYHIMIWDSATKKLIKAYDAILAGIQKNLIALEQDSTLKIIDVTKGETLQVFNRVKKKYGDEYDSYKVRFTPDMKYMMFFTNNNFVAVIDTQTYQLKKTIETGTEVKEITFNKDGSTMLVTDKDSLAIAYDGKTFDKKYELKGHHGTIMTATFSEDNQFILTSSYDKTAMLWDAANGKMIRNFSGKNSTINAAILSADGKFIAQQSNNQVYVWETQTGRKIVTLPVASTRIRFGNDSKTLIINQNYTTQNSNYTAKIINLSTGKLIKDVTFSKEIDQCVISCNGKYLAYLKADSKKLEVQDNEDNPIFNLSTKPSYKISAVTFSPDEKTVFVSYDPLEKTETTNLLVAYALSDKKELWSYQNKLIYNDFKVTENNQYLIARMAADSLICLDIKTGKANYIPYVVPGVKWSDREINSTADGKYVWIAQVTGVDVFDIPSGKKIFEKKTDNWIYFSSVNRDGKLTIAEVENRLDTYDLLTGKLLQSLPTKGNVYDIANENKLTSDKTFLHLYKNNKLIYSLLAMGDDDQIVLDQFGRYDGTEAARKLLYFTCGTEIISLEQVKDLLWVPNLAERISKGEIINAPKLTDLAICGLTPEVETIETKTGDYQFKITPRKGGLGETVLYINDIEIKRFTPAQLTKIDNIYELKIPKTSLTGFLTNNKDNHVLVKAYTAKNDISSRGAKVVNVKAAVSNVAPSLYAVIVGVSDYKGTELDLKYAAKDANDISNALGFSARKLLNTDGKEHVFIYNLNTSKDAKIPEKLAIKNAISEIGAKATANDIFMVFFAGHGVMEGAKKQFYFLTADASKESAVPQVGISTFELSEWMKPANIKAQKRILIFDACNSGQAVNELVKIGGAGQQYLAARNDNDAQQIKAIEKLNEKSGLFILSASASNQSAYEMGKYSQGLLTYALLKAMKEQPEILDDNKFLNVGKWFSAAEKTVTELVRESGNRQEPQVVSTSNFNIGIIDKEVVAAIILPQEHVLFTGSNFQNSDEGIADDDLELSKIINGALTNVSTRGANSNITFVNGTNSPDAYTLSGRYEIKNDNIVVKVNIRRNKELKYKFEVAGKKGELTSLAEEIVKQAAAWASK